MSNLTDDSRQSTGAAGQEDRYTLHVWALTSGLHAASGHLRIRSGADLDDVMGQATKLLREDFDVQHVTLQCEPPGYREAEQEV